MSIASLVRNPGGVEKAMKAIPVAYRLITSVTNGGMHHQSRSLSKPPLFSQISPPVAYRLITSVTNGGMHHQSRSLSKPPLFSQISPPVAYRLITSVTNGGMHHQSRSLSKPPLFSQISPSIAPLPPAFRNVSRSFSTDRHLDPYVRFTRRTAMNWGVRFVPQHEAYVIERFGKFHKVLEAGLHLLVPVVDRIAYIHSLKEQTIDITEQLAVTTDHVSIKVNGLLLVKVIDAEKASYGNDNVMHSVIQLAQTVMRSAVGKMPLDKIFMERENLNANIVAAINDLATHWGLVCRRYEIKEIIPPPGIRDSMVMQAEAERRKRAVITEAEGKRGAVITEAEGKREAVILTSEAAKTNSINRATGEAEAIRIIAEAIQGNGGQAAASLKVAQDYVQAFNKMAKETTTMLLPASLGDPSSMVASALALYNNIVVDKHGKKVFQDNSTPAPSEGQSEHDEAIETEERPVFSLQSTKKD